MRDNRKKLFGNLGINKRSNYPTGINMINEGSKYITANYEDLIQNPFIQPLIQHFTTAILENKFVIKVDGNKIENKAILKVLNNKPNTEVNYKQFIENIVTDLIIYGESYVGITRNEMLVPIELNNINRRLVTIRSTSPRKETNYTEKKTYLINGEQIVKEDLLHFTLTSYMTVKADGISNETFLKDISSRLMLISKAKSVLADNFSSNKYHLILPQRHNDFSREKKEQLALEAMQLLSLTKGNKNEVLTLSEDIKLVPQLYEKVANEIMLLEKTTLSELCTRYGVALSIYNIEFVNTSENGDKEKEDKSIINFKNSICYELSSKYLLTEDSEVEIELEPKNITQKGDLNERK